jgi:hypothetical protein
MTVFDQNATLIFYFPLNRRFLPTKVSHTKTLIYTKLPAFHALSDAVLKIKIKMMVGSYSEISIFFATLE